MGNPKKTLEGGDGNFRGKINPRGQKGNGEFP